MSLLNGLLPYITLSVLLSFVMDAIDNHRLTLCAVLFYWYICLGIYIVFIRQKVPSQQSTDGFDFKGALRNIYYCLWWPWFLKKKGS